MTLTNDGRILAVGILASALAGCAEQVACVVEVSSGPKTCVLYGKERSKELVRSARTCETGTRAKKCPDGAKKICLEKSVDRTVYYYAEHESKKDLARSCEADGHVTVD